MEWKLSARPMIGKGAWDEGQQKAAILRKPRMGIYFSFPEMSGV